MGGTKRYEVRVLHTKNVSLRDSGLSAQRIESVFIIAGWYWRKSTSEDLREKGGNRACWNWSPIRRRYWVFASNLKIHEFF